MEVTVNLFGPYREAVGEKEHVCELSSGATVGDLFRDLEEDYPGLAGEIVDGNGNLSGSVTVSINGTHATLLDGAETALEDGDVVRASPPVHGG